SANYSRVDLHPPVAGTLLSSEPEDKQVRCRLRRRSKREPCEAPRPTTSLRRMTQAPATTPLQDDLLAMLQATRAAERELFAMLPATELDRPGTMGAWSAKDVQLHLAAWRAIEA